MRKRVNFRFFLLFVILGVTSSCVDRNAYLMEYPPEQTTFAVTDDDWKLVVYHLPPVGEANDEDPVVMCHGLSSASVTFDQGEDRGLGPYMARLGYDVWLLNLRGRPPGSHPGDGSDKKYGWTVDDYVNRDMPALLDHVLQQTGKRNLTWIAHSMGGMVAYSYLGTHQDDRIERLITISTPVVFTDLDERLVSLIKHVKKWVQPEEAVHFNFWSRVGFSLNPRSFMHNYLAVVANFDNLSDDQWRRYLANGVGNVSGGVALQVSEWSEKNVMRSVNGSVDYRENMRNIKLPFMAMAGQVDILAPPHMVQPIMGLTSSEDKIYRLFSVENGLSADYGHLDIILGPKVNQEVFPVITEWLANHE